jgi:hypothetical protein
MTAHPAARSSMRSSPVTNLVSAALLLLSWSLVGTMVGVVLAIPAQFGGAHSADRVGHDWINAGTGISPPLAPLVVLAAAIALASRPGAVARVAALAGITVVCVLAVVAGLGELASSPHPTGFDLAIQIVWIGGGSVLAARVLWLAWASPASRLTRRRG